MPPSPDVIVRILAKCKEMLEKLRFLPARSVGAISDKLTFRTTKFVYSVNIRIERSAVGKGD